MLVLGTAAEASAASRYDVLSFLFPELSRVIKGRVAA